MIRPSDQFRDQVDRLFWEYVEKMDDGSMTCAFCGHLFAQHTSISRIKLHLSGVVGRDVKICGQVPQDVQDAARAAIDGPPEKNLKTVAGSSNGVMAQQGDALLESENNDVENMVRVRTEAVEEEENNSGRLEQPVAGASSFGGLVDNTMCQAPGRSVEDSIDNGTGGVAQPGAEASSSGGLRHNPSETRWSYDVFLSFRGEDTRKTITDHLYSALIQAGIRTFRDDSDLPRGEEISPQLLRAIEGSRISVVVFSRNYASSRWCLDELVKIMECRQKTPQVVLPIFYDMDPSDVRKQTGSYAKAFDEHEEHFKEEMEKVNRWREALTQAANLSGRVLHNETNGYEAELIKMVVSDVACKLVLLGARASSSGGLVGNTNEIKGDALPTRKLVGQAFEDNKKFIWSLLMGDEVSSIGIYGMGGVGKTTLVTHLYNQLKRIPETLHAYWITASQDTSIYRLQSSLARHIGLDLSNEDDEMHRVVLLKKELMKQRHKWVLIIDDLWKAFDLQKLGIPDQAEGCKLILTTRSKKICQQMKTQHAIKLQPILEEEALTLFIENLGHGITISPEVEQIAVDVVRECAGLPLGIITMARSMRGVDDPHEWRNTLKKLKESNFGDMEDEVFRLLRFSYDRLYDVALQQCLLYCVLFPEGHEIEREELIFYLIDGGIIENMWSREATFEKGHAMLDRLENAGLLERIDGGRAVKMHDLVRDMAVRICKENPSVMGQRRKGIEMTGSNTDRLWNHGEQMNDGGNSTHKTMGKRRKRIVIARSKSGRASAISAYAQEQNNVDMAQQREPLLTGEFERANDLTGAGIELPHDTPDNQDELKKLKGSKSRDMVDDFKSKLIGAVPASAREQNNVEMAQQQESLLTGEFERANDLTAAGIERPRDTPDDQDDFKSRWTLLLTNLILEMASAVFDQLGNALVGMVLAFVALLLSTAELIYMEIMARRESRSLLPWKPVGTIVEYFGLVGAVWQCFYSTVEYAYDRQKKDNPIKMCLLPFIFLLCVVISNFY